MPESVMDPFALSLSKGRALQLLTKLEQEPLPTIFTRIAEIKINA